MIVERFYYLNPTDHLGASQWAYLSELLETVAPTLVVIDSTGEGLSLAGWNPNADEQVAAWFRQVARRIANHPKGPAVVLLDHVAKADGSGNWPIGSQRKRAAINGAQYMQHAEKPFSRERAGRATLTVAKDRHGHYRSGQKVAQLLVTPGGDGDVTLDLAYLPDAPLGENDQFRPTALMERVSRYLEMHPGEADRTGSKVRRGVKGRDANKLDALNVLVAEGFVATKPGARSATIFTSVKPFRNGEQVA